MDMLSDAKNIDYSINETTNENLTRKEPNCVWCDQDKLEIVINQFFFNIFL